MRPGIKARRKRSTRAGRRFVARYYNPPPGPAWGRVFKKYRVKYNEKAVLGSAEFLAFAIFKLFPLSERPLLNTGLIWGNPDAPSPDPLPDGKTIKTLHDRIMESREYHMTAMDRMRMAKIPMTDWLYPNDGPIGLMVPYERPDLSPYLNHLSVKFLG